MNREELAKALLDALRSLEKADPWAFMDLNPLDDYRAVWIETTGALDLRDLADHLIGRLQGSESRDE